MQISGELIKKGDIEQIGDKEKRTFAIRVGGDYPKNIAFDLWGQKINIIDSISNGDTVEVDFDLNSREYNGKWYTNATAWKVTANKKTAPVNDAVKEDSKDLPF